ncbi:hypothetical protein N6L24_13255 [Cognatishimia sp. SS12]|nr:hypothetical protein [Cognatishimia sp. SS12]
MIAVLGLGMTVFLQPKGTRQHRLKGRAFVGMMLISNVAVFGIYQDSPNMGVFHYLAIISIVSLVLAVALLRVPGLSQGRRVAHGHVMLWTFGGVVAAGLGQGATALGYSPWPAIVLALLCIALIAAKYDFAKAVRRTPRN